LNLRSVLIDGAFLRFRGWVWPEPGVHELLIMRGMEVAASA
jgi:hypothetical protein